MKKFKKTTGRKIKPLVETKIKFQQFEIDEALLFIDDLLDRCLCPYFLLDELAKVVFEDQHGFELSEVSLGIRDRYLTQTVGQIMLMREPDIEIRENTISLTHNKVPIVIWRIHNDIDVFRNPDTKFYSILNVKIPNPFSEYWKKRDLIK